MVHKLLFKNRNYLHFTKISSKGAKDASVHPVIPIDEGAPAATGLAKKGITQPEMDAAEPVAAVWIAAGRAGCRVIAVVAWKFQVAVTEIPAECSGGSVEFR